MRRIGKQLRKYGGTRRRKLVLAAAAILVLLGGSALGAAAYTQRSTYCADVCHEMQPYGATWRASAHRQVPCVRCHVEPGSANFLRAKLTALREVWVHAFGQPSEPLQATRQVPDDACTADACHPRVAVMDSITNAGVTLSHADHVRPSACRDCHAHVVHDEVPGRSFVDPAAMAFCLRCHDDDGATAQCTPCHDRPHAARGRCITCHTRSSWASCLDHPGALGRSHQKVRCERCHARGAAQGTVTAASASSPMGCVACHRYRHTPTLTDCAACHTMRRWTPSTYRHPASGCLTCHTRPHADRGTCLTCHATTTWTSRFVHSLRLGAHAGMSCERCHTRGVGRAAVSCSACHGDHHGGLTDCRSCHTTSSWSPSTYRHPASGCLTCHTRPHADRGTCLTCHATTTWTSRFVHSLRLGAHAGMSCERCHTRGVGRAAVSCSACHGDHHGGLTDCRSCHTTSSWSPSTYRHRSVSPHLPAGTVPLACAACHPATFSSATCSCHDAGTGQD